MTASRPDDADVVRLKLLTPQYNAAQHGLYISQLLAALERPDVRRIALAGQYGTGKSSILQGLVQDKTFQEMKLNPVTVSLATLDPVATPEKDHDANDSSTDSQTNRIQREVVKQLLHTAPPWEVPLSRYRRLSKPKSWRLWAPVVLVALFAGVVTMLTLNLSLASNPWMRATSIAIMAAGAAWVYRTRLQGRFLFSELKAGTEIGSLSVADHSTWFDQYLDEIIYFFDSSECRLVIFEDIDRFDDPQIFETLRDLNVLLNNAEQLKRRRRRGNKEAHEVPIRFLYAARDSAFDVSGDHPRADQNGGSGTGTDLEPDRQVGGAASASASRVKYFDYLISVVPFVTPASARDHFKELLQEAGLGDGYMPGRQVLICVSRHVSDFRLITAITNDYLVFNRLVRHESKLKGLKADNLFALMVYKNTHPADFERILSGDSKFNHLHEALQRETRRSLKALDDARQALRNRVGDETPSIEQRITLSRFINLSTEHRSQSTVKVPAADLTFNEQDPLDPEFWRNAVQHGISVTSRVNSYNSYPPYTLSPAALGEAVGLTGGEQAWSQQERERVGGLEKSLNAARTHVLASSFAQAMTGAVLPADDLALVTALDELRVPLTDISSIVETLDLDALTIDLLNGGYIDQYFSVYVSRYKPTTLSVSARNFMMVVIENPTAEPDFFHQFANVDEDVPAVLAEAGNDLATDERALNIHIFDYVLKAGRNRPLVALAAGQSQNAQDFRVAYLKDGAHPTELVAAITPRWVQAFQTLVQHADEELRLALIETALQHAEPHIDYATSRDVVNYLRAHEVELPAITKCPADEATRLAQILETLQYRSSSLYQLPQPLARALVSRHAYDINDPNLTFVASTSAPEDVGLDEQEKDLDERARIALDRIPQHQWDYLKGHLKEYVRLLNRNKHHESVHDDDKVVSTLNFFAEDASGTLNMEELDLLIARAGSSPITQSDLELTLWPASARAGRTDVTTQALLSFLDVHEAGLQAWVALLQKATFELDPTSVDDSERLVDLSLAILKLTELSASKRVALIEQIAPSLDVGQVPDEAKALIPELVRSGTIPDSAETLQHVAAHCSQALQDLVTVSTQIDTYIVEVEPSTALLKALAEPSHTDAFQKLLKHPNTPDHLDEPLARQLLHDQARSSLKLPREVLDAAIAVAQTPVVAARALAARAQSYTDEQLITAIAGLGGPAAKLGMQNIEVPEEYLPLVDALKTRHLIKSRKVPKKPKIRTTVINP